MTSDTTSNDTSNNSISHNASLPPETGSSEKSGLNTTPTIQSIQAAGQDAPPGQHGEPPGDRSVLTDPEMTRVSTGPAYSVFSKSTRRWILAIVTIATFVSPMTANIYFPVLEPIAHDLGVSISLINLTLTTYMIFQGLSPTIFGDLSEGLGRRPAYIVAFVVYVGANLGLALQRSYPALLVLRMVQSAGSSGTLVLGFAMIADISSTAERGKYMGIVGAGINVGPALGPVIGGLLSEYLGWPAIFWFCTIFSVAWLVPWVLFGPETCRNVVGNGSIAPQRWNRPLIDLTKKDPHVPQTAPSKSNFKFPNPLRTLSIVWEKEMALILFLNAIIYLDFILVAATLGTIWKEIYGFNDLEIGLCYLPYGFGCAVAVVGQGYVLDWNYRRIAKKIGFAVDRRRGNSLAGYPIEKARIQPIYPTVMAGVLVMIGYGWALHYETSVAVPLVLVFLIGMLIPTSFSVLNTLIVDLNPQAPATATAANNLVRCLHGAGMTAAIDYMLTAMGRGWCFTFLALIMMATLPALWLIDQRGLQWRVAKVKRDELRQAEGESN